MSDNHPLFSRRLLSTLLIALLAGYGMLSAEIVRAVYHPESIEEELETGVYPIASSSDSVYCGTVLLERGTDYRINYRNGHIKIELTDLCDSLTIIVYRIPEWLAQSEGNPIPSTDDYLKLPNITEMDSSASQRNMGKINLSGNKSFSFNVGRSGEGVFSQGLNIDFDAAPSPGLKIRGAISDRIGGENQVTTSGETVLISELDKYYFEIDGRRITARGGDINSLFNDDIPAKRIKGIYGAYHDSRVRIEGDLGRPAGRFRTQKIQGIDGRQGPYQLLSNDGLPTVVTAGSETVYLDGQKLEGGRGGDYEIDYYAGRITFLPGILITSRSRIEIDYETTQSYYEQLIYDGTASLELIPKYLTFVLGARRETDDQNKLKLGSLSSSDIDLLKAAGDSSGLAQKSGVVAADSGSYALETDTSGVEYYRFVGRGNGDYNVSFSRVGDSSGSYNYLGDGVYEFVGENQGDFAPVIFLPLPERTDFFYASGRAIMSQAINLNLSYQLNIRDRNLFSPLEDGDNDRSQWKAGINIKQGAYHSSVSARFQQDGFDPAERIYVPDYNRRWALPEGSPAGDEIIIESEHEYRTNIHALNITGGYIDYKNNLEGYRVEFDGIVFQTNFISPSMKLRLSKAQEKDNPAHEGRLTAVNPSITFRPLKDIGWTVSYDYEKLENHYGDLANDEGYRTFKTVMRWRNSSIAYSRRTDMRTIETEKEGPRLDKVDINLQESYRRWTIGLGGTWSEQKRLESDRDNLNELLLQGRLQYNSRSGWLNLNAIYRQNREETKASGYRYYAVDPGTGDYRYEDGQYLPDPEGDYIRLREETGDYRSVSTGEKSHVITIYPGRIGVPNSWKRILDQVALNLRTEIKEEMTDKANRKWNWLIPWISDSDREYVSRSKSEQYQVRLFPSHNFYMVTFEYINGFSEENDASALFRSLKKYRAEYKYQFIPPLRLRIEASRELDDERGSGMSSLDLISDYYTAGLIYNEGNIQLEPALTYNRFKDNYSTGRGRGVWFELLGVYRASQRGEIRYNIILRSLKENEPFSQPEYLVTEGRRFGRSVLLNLNAGYNLGSSLRLNLNVTDRMFESRAPEFIGRGELVASF